MAGIRQIQLSKKALGIGVLVFFVGFAAFGGMNTFFAYTNRMEFCTSCHSMKINLEEYKETVHYKNRTGVQATCADCHVPKEFFPKLKAKIFAAKDVYHHILGTIDTKEKFEKYRWKMANQVWDKMKSTNSRECRTCHDFANMDLSAQSKMARNKHSKATNGDETCIDCHKGIAHFEPYAPDEEGGASDKGKGKGDGDSAEKAGDGQAVAKGE